ASAGLMPMLPSRAAAPADAIAALKKSRRFEPRESNSSLIKVSSHLNGRRDPRPRFTAPRIGSAFLYDNSIDRPRPVVKWRRAQTRRPSPTMTAERARFVSCDGAYGSTWMAGPSPGHDAGGVAANRRRSSLAQRGHGREQEGDQHIAHDLVEVE